MNIAILSDIHGNHIALEKCLDYLNDKDIEFFNSLPITMTIKNDGMPDIVICHGSPRKINEKLTTNEKAIKEVANETESDYIICGHTHSKADIQYGTTCIWNPGSVGTSIDEPYGYLL